MIDFIKVYTYTKESLENRIKNDFPDSETKCSYDYFNKTPKYPCKRYFENIEVRITDKSAFVRNSIHTYFNLKNGVAEGNYTDFSYGDILTALSSFRAI